MFLESILVSSFELFGKVGFYVRKGLWLIVLEHGTILVSPCE